MTDSDDPDSGPADDEDFGPDEADRIDEPATIECPYCSREVLEEAGRCPYCGSYLTSEDTPRHRPWRWIVAVILLVLLVLHYVLHW